MAPPIRRPKVDILHGPIQDQHTVQAFREVEKRLQALADAAQALQISHDVLTTTVANLSTGQNQLTAAVQQSRAQGQRTATTVSGGGGGGTGGGGDSGTDNGQGAAGFNSAGPNGDIGTGHPLTPLTAGQVIGGTDNEFPALLAIAADQPTRMANNDQLLSRIIWHLTQAGFVASHYTISSNPYVVVIDALVDGLPAVYRVIGYENFDVPMVPVMVFAERSARLQPVVGEAGTPD